MKAKPVSLLVKAVKAVNELNLAKSYSTEVPGSVHSRVLSILTKNNVIAKHFSKN